MGSNPNDYSGQTVYSKDVCSLMRRLTTLADECFWEVSVTALERPKAIQHGELIYILSLYEFQYGFQYAGLVSVSVRRVNGEEIASETIGDWVGPSPQARFTYAIDDGVLYLIHKYQGLTVKRYNATTLEPIGVSAVLSSYPPPYLLDCRVENGIAYILGSDGILRRHDMATWSYVSSQGQYTAFDILDGEVMAQASSGAFDVLDASDLSVKRSWTSTGLVSFSADNEGGMIIEATPYNGVMVSHIYRDKNGEILEDIPFSNTDPWRIVSAFGGLQVHMLYAGTAATVKLSAECLWQWYKKESRGILGLSPSDNLLVYHEADFVTKHITDMRRLVERLAVFYDLNWTEDDPDNLYYLAMGDRTKYGATGGERYTWTRTPEEMVDTPMYDIDIGEIEECVTYLEAL